MNAACIPPGQKAGAARRADGALAVGMSKGHTALHQAVDVRRANVLIAEAMDGIPSLLVSTNPENVGLQGELSPIPFSILTCVGCFKLQL